MLSLLFNLITDLTGGVRLTVVELGDARRTVKTRKKGSRIAAAAGPLRATNGTDPAAPAGRRVVVDLVGPRGPLSTVPGRSWAADLGSHRSAGATRVPVPVRGYSSVG